MTPEERAEARRLAGQVARDREDDCDCAECRLASATLAALDALESAERERDEARDASAAKGAALCGAVNASSSMLVERDTARARLAEVERKRDEAFGLVFQYENALKAMERERDEFRAKAEFQARDAITCGKERDTARAQVETLAGALRWYAANAGAVSWDCDSGSRARAALKAAEIET